jgi:hypothetical protein
VTIERSGPLPKDLDARVAARDTTPLGDGVVVRFQRIGLEKSPAKNYRWELHEDGSWYAARHSGETEDWQQPFDTELPQEPVAQVPAEAVADLLELLASEDFADQEPYQVGATARGGRVEIVRALVGGREHEVLYENAETPALEALSNLFWEYGG